MNDNDRSELRDKAEAVLDQAVLWVILRRSYFASLLLNLQKVWVEGERGAKLCQTMMVDNSMRLYLNTEYVAALTKKEARFSLLHELHHLVRSHHARQGYRDVVGVSQNTGARVTVWNMAGDLEINNDLVDDPDPGLSGVLEEMEFEPLLPKTFGLESDLTAETYYDLLLEQLPHDDQDDQSGSGAGDDDQDDQSGSGAGDDDQDDQSGSGAGDDDQLPHGCMTVTEDGDSLDSEAMEQHSKRHSQTAVEAVMEGTAREILECADKEPGKVPAGLVRAASDLVKPVVNWANEFRVQVRAARRTVRGFDFPSYRRFNRRMTPTPNEVLMPARASSQPEVAVLVDTSGSMGESELRHALSEIGGIVEALNHSSIGDPIPVWCCDVEVYGPTPIRKVEELKLTGGGGTHMPHGLAAIKEALPAVDIIICLTDGCTAWPDWGQDDPKLIVGLINSATYLDNVNSALLNDIPETAATVLIPISQLKAA